MKARESRVKSCNKCNGKPISTSSFSSPPFEGIKCDECFEILDYEPMQSDKELKQVIEITPKLAVLQPNMNFDLFKVIKENE